MSEGGTILLQVCEMIAAFVAGLFGAQFQVWIKSFLSGNKIATKDTSVQQNIRGGGTSAGGATFGMVSGGTINVFPMQGIEVDYRISENSSPVIEPRTINRLELCSKTILKLPIPESGKCVDAMIRIDTGNELYPLGVSTDKNVFDAFSMDWLNLTPNARNYLSFTYMGNVVRDGVMKYVWIVSCQTASSIDGVSTIGARYRQTKYGTLDASGSIKYADPLLCKDGVLWGNVSDEMMLAHGYKIIENNNPGSCRPGYYWRSNGWKDDGQRVFQEFQEVLIPRPDPNIEKQDLKSILSDVSERLNKLDA